MTDITLEQRARELLAAECPECGGGGGFMVPGEPGGNWHGCGTCQDGERLHSVNRDQALRAIEAALRLSAGADWVLVPMDVLGALVLPDQNCAKVAQAVLRGRAIVAAAPRHEPGE